MRKEGRDASTRMDGEVLECCSWTPQPQPLLSVPVPPASTSSIHLQRRKTPQPREKTDVPEGCWVTGWHVGVPQLFIPIRAFWSFVPFFLLSPLLDSNDACFDPCIEHNFCLMLEGTGWAFEIHCTSTSWYKMPFTL